MESKNNHIGLCREPGGLHKDAMAQHGTDTTVCLSINVLGSGLGASRIQFWH